jgi:hypothetical protein
MMNRGSIVFHEDIFTMEKWSLGKWRRNMADYCLTTARNAPEAKYKFESSVGTF